MIPIWIDFTSIPLLEYLPVMFMGLIAFIMQTAGYRGNF